MMSTGIEAFKLGMAGFLIPFAFVFQPALLLEGDLLAILKGTGLTAVGIGCLAAALVGHVWTPLNWLLRLLFVTAASLLVFPTIGFELLGMGLALGLFIWAKAQKSASRPQIPPAD
jgi:TRAP-type uncharacterized transport system fused permease subunit